MTDEVKEAPEVDQLVFTYGTLKQGFGNYMHCIKPFIEAGEAEFIESIKTKPNFTMISMGYFPGVICKGNTSITGDLFRMKSAAGIRRLNALEGHYGKDDPSNFYNVTEIETEHGPAIMYVLDESYLRRSEPITSGIWEKNR